MSKSVKRYFEFRKATQLIQNGSDLKEKARSKLKDFREEKRRNIESASADSLIRSATHILQYEKAYEVDWAGNVFDARPKLITRKSLLEIGTILLSRGVSAWVGKDEEFAKFVLSALKAHALGWWDESPERVIKRKLAPGKNKNVPSAYMHKDNDKKAILINTMLGNGYTSVQFVYDPFILTAQNSSF